MPYGLGFSVTLFVKEGIMTTEFLEFAVSCSSWICDIFGAMADLYEWWIN